MQTDGYDELDQDEVNKHWVLFPKKEFRGPPTDNKWRYPFLHAESFELLSRLRDAVLNHDEQLTVLEWDDHFRVEGLID